MVDTADEPGNVVAPYPAAEIAAAWQRERPGTPTGSIEIVTPIWWLARLFANDRDGKRFGIGTCPTVAGFNGTTDSCPRSISLSESRADR